MAEPPTGIERELKVPLPKGTWAVSFWTMAISSMGKPSSSAAICAKLVSCP